MSEVPLWQGRGLGKRRRVAAEAACALEGRLVKVKLVRAHPNPLT